MMTDGFPYLPRKYVHYMSHSWKTCNEPPLDYVPMQILKIVSSYIHVGIQAVKACTYSWSGLGTIKYRREAPRKYKSCFFLLIWAFMSWCWHMYLHICISSCHLRIIAKRSASPSFTDKTKPQRPTPMPNTSRFLLTCTSYTQAYIT